MYDTWWGKLWGLLHKWSVYKTNDHTRMFSLPLNKTFYINVFSVDVYKTINEGKYLCSLKTNFKKLSINNGNYK